MAGTQPSNSLIDLGQFSELDRFIAPGTKHWPDRCNQCRSEMPSTQAILGRRPTPGAIPERLSITDPSGILPDEAGPRGVPSFVPWCCQRGHCPPVRPAAPPPRLCRAHAQEPHAHTHKDARTHTHTFGTGRLGTQNAVRAQFLDVVRHLFCCGWVNPQMTSRADMPLVSGRGTEFR